MTAEFDPRSVAVRYSALKYMAQSRAHYLHALQSQREETLSMRLGSGTHALIFGTPEIVIYRGGEMVDEKGKKKVYTDVRNGKFWEDFQKKNEGKLILSESEHERATAMARALTSDMLADALLFAPGTEHEKEVAWSFFGRRCAGRIDALGPHAVPDLKTAKDASRRWFPRQAINLGYHGQATWYADGCEAAGLGWRHPYLIAVENTAPFVVTVWRLTDGAIADGRRRYREWFERVLECEETGVWPGYASDVLELDVIDREPVVTPPDADVLAAI